MPLTPSLWGKLLNPNYDDSPAHIVAMERALLKLMRRPGKHHLLVELPVRHGKSEFFSFLTPTWHLLLNPRDRVILSGYSGEFASDFGRRALKVFNAYAPPLVGHGVGDRATSDFWTTDKGGSLLSVGTHGSVTGKGADLLIADDLVKSQQEAESEGQREGIWKWFHADLLSRLTPTGKAIVVMSRRHPDDVVGRIKERLDPASWDFLRLPALAEADDPLGRTAGEPLWPGVWDRDKLEGERRRLELAGSPYLFDCLYQQSPLGDPASMLFDHSWLSHPDLWYERLPVTEEQTFCRILSCDPSKGKKQTSDYTALLYVLCDRQRHLWVEDSLIQRISTTQVEEACVAMWEHYRPHALGIEANAFQEMLADNVIKRLPPGSQVIKVVHTDEKIMRVRFELTEPLSSRRVHFKDTPANRLLVAQLKSFPAGTHDDGPDSLGMATQIVNMLITGLRSLPPKTRLRL